MVSVIIPVYNTAKYLDASVRSIVDQTYKDLQIILVDDGAKDESPQMCDAWAKKDSRIQVIHKVNEGLGFTRNAGLEAAIGEYVCFFDSDDTLDPETIEECVRTLETENADACFYGRKTQQKSGEFTINEHIPEKLVYTNEEVKEEFARIYIGRLPRENYTDYIQASACCAMYKSDIIKTKQLRFLSERDCLSEDTFFNLNFCNYAKKVIIIPKNFYNYTYNMNSLTKSYNPNKMNQTKSYIQELEKYKDGYHPMERIEERIAYSFYIYFRHAMEYEVKAWKVNGLLRTYKRIRELCRDSFLIEWTKKIPLEGLDKKKKLFISLYLHKQVLLLMVYYMKK